MPAKDTELTVLFEHNPPFQMVGKNGEGYGPVIDLTKKMLQQAQIEAEFVAQPWARILTRSATHKNALILSMARIPSREADFIWLSEIYRGYSYVWKVRGREDIEPRLIAVERGSHKLETLRAIYGPNQVVEYRDSEQALANLLKGHVQRYVGLPFAVAGKMNELHQPMSKLQRLAEFSEPGAGVTRMYLALTRQSDPKLVAKLKTALELPQLRQQLEAIKGHFAEKEMEL